MAYAFQKMVDMAKTPADVKQELKDMPSCGPSGSTSVYPYGLCMSWDEEILDKLGLGDELPEVGDIIHIVMMAKVTSVSESETETTDGARKKRCRIELQGTHVATENEDMEGDEARGEKVKRRYGESEGHEEGSPAVDAGERHVTRRAYAT